MFFIPTVLFFPHLKNDPKILIISISFISILAFLGNQVKAFTVTFYLVLGLNFYTSFFLLTNWVLDIIIDHRGWYIDPETGEKFRVQDPSFLLGFLIGIVLTPILISLYHKNFRRNKNIEMISVSIFAIVTVTVYLIHKFSY